MGRLDGKVAIVTGAGSLGMGRATAILLVAEGARVVVNDVVVEDGEQTAATIKEAGGEAIFVSADVSQSADWQHMIRRAVDSYGKLDILFNNAGVFGPPGLSIADYTEEGWDKLMSVNLKGVFLGMKYAIPEMIKNGGGAIVNNASTSGLRANPGGGLYGTAKAGVIHLTKVGALEYGDRNIRINCICPYGIRPSGRGATALKSPEKTVSRSKEEEDERWRKAQLPMKRTGKTEEIAHVVVFLASEESSWVNGAVLPVDGASVAGYFGRFR